MKLLNKINLCVVLCLFSIIAQAEHLPMGTDVLANCHGFFAKGKIKRLHKEHYVIDFYKESRPLLCTPFAWDSMFLVTYKPVSEFTGKLKTKSGFFSVSNEELFKIGDKLQIDFEASSRGKMFSNDYSVTVAIKEINHNGAALLETIGGKEDAKRAFERWVGGNYVSLDFSEKLVADRLTILTVEKK